MLVEEGLIPDRYPCQWKFNGVFEILQRNKSHSWKWGSPLSFILSHSPFCEKSAKAVEFLVQAGKLLYNCYQHSMLITYNVERFEC